MSMVIFAFLLFTSAFANLEISQLCTYQVSKQSNSILKTSCSCPGTTDQTQSIIHAYSPCLHNCLARFNNQECHGGLRAQNEQKCLEQCEESKSITSIKAQEIESTTKCAPKAYINKQQQVPLPKIGVKCCRAEVVSTYVSLKQYNCMSKCVNARESIIQSASCSNIAKSENAIRNSVLRWCCMKGCKGKISTVSVVDTSQLPKYKVQKVQSCVVPINDAGSKPPITLAYRLKPVSPQNSIAKNAATLRSNLITIFAKDRTFQAKGTQEEVNCITNITTVDIATESYFNRTQKGKFFTIQQYGKRKDMLQRKASQCNRKAPLISLIRFYEQDNNLNMFNIISVKPYACWYAKVCGPVVKVYSNKYIRHQIINKAINKLLLQTPSFSDIFDRNKVKIREDVVFQNGARYAVLIPHSEF